MNLCKIVLTLACLLSVTTVDAAVIYRETFGRPVPDTNFDMHTSVFDWADFGSSGAWVDMTGIANFGINGSTNGRPIDVANVNAGPNSDGTFGAYARGIHYFLAAGGTPTLSMTPEYSFDPSIYETLTFSWYEGNANVSDTMRLALRIGGQWYVGATAFSTPATSLGNFPTTAELKQVTYNPAPANWLTLNFDGSYDTGTDTGTDSSGAMSLPPMRFLNWSKSAAKKARMIR